MSQPQTFLQELSKDFEELYDDLVVTDESNDKVEVIPTSSTSLNVCLGIGGIPKGKYTEIYGPESAGKTTLGLDIAKNAMSKGDKVLYIDVENMIDYKYIEAIIGEYDKKVLVIVQPETAEQALSIVEKGIFSTEFGLIIVDSVAALAPQKEKENELTDETYAGISKLLTRFFRRINYDVRLNKVAVVFINQLRDKIGSYIKDFDTPGGHALKHYCSIRIYLYPSDKLKESDSIVGNLVKFTIKKNKMAPPFRTFQFPLFFGKGIDTTKDTLEFAKKLNIVRTRGAYYYFDEIKLGQGEVDALQTLYNDPELLDKISKLCYNIMNINSTTEKGIDNE